MYRKICLLFAGFTLLLLTSSSALAENLSFKLLNSQNKVLCEASSPIKSGKAEINLNFERDFLEGDYIVVQGSKYLYINLFDSISGSYIYAPEKVFKFLIPLKEKGQVFSMSAFSGTTHKINIRSCSQKEWKVSRNIALNPFDNRGSSLSFPHATSNSEYGNQSIYAARNVIDGFKSNQNHGKWPYQSWGPYKSDSIWLKIDFGTVAEVNKVVIVNRAQFDDNHDSAWQYVILEFSDGTSERITLKKTHLAQEIKIKKHKTSFIKFRDLKPFEVNWCAWTEVEVWGKYLKD